MLASLGTATSIKAKRESIRTIVESELVWEIVNRPMDQAFTI